MPESAGAARRVAGNALNPFVVQVLGRVLMMGYSIVQYRVLGAQADGVLGSYFLAALVLTYAGTVSEWGLGTLLTRDVARARGAEIDRVQVRKLFVETLSLRLLLSVALFLPVGLFILVYGGFANWGEDGAWALLILTVSLLPNAFSGTVTSVLNAYERMTLPALVGIGTSAVNVALGLGALLIGWGVIGLAWAALAATCATAVVFFVIWRREFPELGGGSALGFHISRSVAIGLLAAGWPLLLNSLLIGLFFRVDQFIVQPVLGNIAVEKYNAAYSYLNFVLLITPAVTLALFPRMSRHAQDDLPRLAREFSFALKVLLILSGLIVILTVWFAPFLITVLTAGNPAYQPDSAIALQILILFLPFSFVNGVTQYVLIALDRQRLITRAFALTLVFNVAANVVLVPVLGIYGAALVTVLSELVLLVPFLLWVNRALASTGGGLRVDLAWKPLVAGVAAGAIMFMLWAAYQTWNRDLGSIALYFGIGALVAVVYAAALLVLRPFTSDEANTLLRVFRRGS